MSIGPDLASVDGNGNPDWSTARTQGHMRFVGLRASYGTAPDSKYGPYAMQLQKLGIPFFGYLFLRFGDNVGTPQAQAHTALSVIGKPNVRSFTPVVDLEFGGKRPTGWSAQQTLDWFMDAWRTMKSELGADPGVYTSEVVWIDPDQMNNPNCPEIANAWSWTKYWPYAVRTPAHYDPTETNALPTPKVAPPFKGNWNMQQYQGDALHYPGFINTVDLNRQNLLQLGSKGGTVAWLQRKLKITADGNFGPMTESAVKTFQFANGLYVDGIAGYDTQAVASWIKS